VKIAIDRYRRILALVGQLEIAVAAMLMAAIVAVITVQVLRRYVFGDPLVWAEEFSTYAFIWASFLGASVGMKQFRHIKVEMFSLRIGMRAQATFRLFGCVVMALALSALAFKASGVMAIEASSSSISLPFEISRKWFYSVPLYATSISMIATLAYYALSELAYLITGETVQLVDSPVAVESGP
jgi:TRAP-type C4-dicarboxylate transport system permease small subunit